MEYKTEVPGMYKVTEGIVINKDNDALMKYKARKKAMLQKDHKINTLEQRVDELARKLDMINSMLLIQK
jgi:hypothetical protein